MEPLERVTQNRIVKLFKEQLGYEYLGDWKDRDNKNIESDRRLKPFLQKQGYSDKLIERALRELDQAAALGDGRSLCDADKEVLCRQNQYFGIKEVQDYIRRRQGGLDVIRNIGCRAQQQKLYSVKRKKPNSGNGFVIRGFGRGYRSSDWQTQATPQEHGVYKFPAAHGYPGASGPGCSPGTGQRWCP